MASAYDFAEASVFGAFLVVCMVSRLLILALICWRALRILAFSGVGVGIGVDASVLICSYACWNVFAIFSNVARSIVILLAFVLHEASYISCSCLRAWNNSCSASVSAFVAGVSVGETVMVSW